MELSKIGLPILEIALEIGEEEVIELVSDLEVILPHEERKNFWVAQ